MMDCDKIFEEIKNDQLFPTMESKLRYFASFEQSCGGSGLYDSRLSFLYAQVGDIPAARAALEKGLSTDNEYHTSLKYSLADLWVQEGDLEKANKLAENLIVDHADWYGGYMLLAKINLMQQNFEQSVQYGIKANSIEPTAGVFVGLAIAYHQLDQDQLAIDAMMEAIKLDSRVLASKSGTNEAIYSLVNLDNLQGASEMAYGRILSDAHWREDPTFVKAVAYLKDHGFSIKEE